MKLGLAIGYSGAPSRHSGEARAGRAEELGYDFRVDGGKAYGSDAVTPLAFLAAHTSRIKLGTGIMQLAARHARQNAAMSAATVDAMAGGGRLHRRGSACQAPQNRRRLVRPAVGTAPTTGSATMSRSCARSSAREGTGHARWPRDPVALYRTGRQWASASRCRSILHMNPDIPIYLATGSESTVKLTAEDRRRAGCRWASCRAPWKSTGRGWTRAFRRARETAKSLKDLAIHRRGACRARQRRLPARFATAQAGSGRLYVGGMGQQHQELPQRHHGPPRIIGGRPPSGSRSSTWRSARDEAIRRRPPTSGST